MGEDPNKEHYNLVEYDDYWVIPIRGKPISRFLVDYDLTLEFLDPEDERTTIVISSEFGLETEGKRYTLSSEAPTKLGPVFALFGKNVASVLAHKDGKLEIKFVDCSELTVLPHPKYEAWNIVGVRWLRIVCMPGGNLAVWKPDPPDS